MKNNYLGSLSKKISSVESYLEIALDEEDYEYASKLRSKIKCYLDEFSRLNNSKNIMLMYDVTEILINSEYSKAQSLDSLIDIFKNNFESRIDYMTEKMHSSETLEDKKFYRTQVKTLHYDLDKFLKEYVKK